MEDATRGRTSSELTILFADISGSSLMYAVRGDAEAHNLATTCLNLMDEQVTRHGGRVFKRVGDAVLAVFNKPESAVRAAEDIQRAIGTPNSVLQREKLHVRVGVSCGTAVLDEGDVYGDVVNVAARLLSHASPDEVFLSEHVYEQLPEELRASTRLVDQMVLRGRPSLMQVYQYLWKEESDATVAMGPRTHGPMGTLEVSYGTRVFHIAADRPKLKIGRAADNDISIEHDVVSRYHAEINLRGDKFFLTDSSTNGTFVRTDSGEVLHVSREEVPLSGSGRILPGAESVQPIAYQLIQKG